MSEVIIADYWTTKIDLSTISKTSERLFIKGSWIFRD
jgi:hypothetical protein